MICKRANELVICVNHKKTESFENPKVYRSEGFQMNRKDSTYNSTKSLKHP